MKQNKSLLTLVIALAAMTGGSSEDHMPQFATQQQLEDVTGHWYTEIPLTGETANWRTEEEGDVTDYDHIGALIYLNGYDTESSYWGYIFLKDDELVNFDGIFQRDKEARFDFTMFTDGRILTSNHLSDAPEVSNMLYADGKITADVSYKGQSFTLTFTRPTEEQEPHLQEYWELLAEAGIVGGYTDDGDTQQTNVSDENAYEPSRAETY